MKIPKTPYQKSLKYRSFELAYRAVAKPLMLFIIKRMHGDIGAAEDVFSQTIVAALRGWHAFEHKSSFLTWVCKIALNKMADYWRERINQRSKIVAPTLEQLSKISSPKLSPEEALALKELKSAVYECLMLIPEDKRKILYLRYFEELTLRKIGEIFGISERAAEGRVYRAKKELKDIMLQKYPELSFAYTK